MFLILCRFVAQEIASCRAVVADAELMMLMSLWPIKFNVHVVLAGLKVYVFFPSVTHPTHFAVFISQNFLFVIRVFYFHYDKTDVRVFVIDLATEAPLVCLNY